MTRRLHRGNRFFVLFVGSLAVAAGVLALVRHLGGFGAREAAQPLLDDDLQTFVADSEAVFWPAVAAGFVLLALIGVVVLRTQLRRAGIDELDLPTGDDSAGATELRAGAATDALEDDLEADPEVIRASARCLSGGAVPTIHVRIDVPDGSDLAAVRARIESEAIPRLALAIERDRVEATLQFRLSEPSSIRILA